LSANQRFQIRVANPIAVNGLTQAQENKHADPAVFTLIPGAALCPSGLDFKTHQSTIVIHLPCGLSGAKV
jgi:hypothetical protein